MKISEGQTQKILSGAVQCKFNQLGFNMLISRMERAYRSDSTSTVLAQCTQEINNFLAKYEKIMGKDYALIAQI